MSFCNTPELNRRWTMLGFAMHCSGLATRLFNLSRAHEGEEQIRLFRMTLEEREEFVKFAKNLQWFITPYGIHDEGYWQGLSEHKYTDYEFRALFDPFQKDKTESVIALLEKVGNGEELNEDEMGHALGFLRTLSSYAYAKIERGGCF